MKVWHLIAAYAVFLVVTSVIHLYRLLHHRWPKRGGHTHSSFFRS
jgi:hypothetical protein